MGVNAAADVDGRRLRRQQNREAVVDALVELFAEGSYTPSSAEIAERAGLSPRSLFRYFDDMDDVSRAAIERQLAEARPLFTVDAEPGDPTAHKIERIVRSRLRLFESIAPGARAGRACAHNRPVVAEQLHEARTFFRAQIRSLFAPELRGRSHLLPAIDVLLSFEARDLLCVEQGLSTAKATTTLVAALTALLEEPRS